ncbi:MAG: hypothetical protein BWY63_00784 [Chloroflexi bacterium ADurb.Bin360]|nr:MAG: hypothetical protein BWY63_00784 [Chloroflexi bacterium ADurb.Bin360]
MGYARDYNIHISIGEMLRRSIGAQLPEEHGVSIPQPTLRQFMRQINFQPCQLPVSADIGKGFEIIADAHDDGSSLADACCRRDLGGKRLRRWGNIGEHRFFHRRFLQQFHDIGTA